MSVTPSKNTSPSQLSFFTAMAIAIITTGVSLLFKQPWYYYILILLISFTSSYYIFYNTIKFFIYRKVKIIYKIIYQTKATKRENFFYKNILPQKSIEQVSRDVERWAISKKSEIEILERNEQFRKEFLMNLAHELKTPIFTAQSYIDTLLTSGLKDPEISERFLKNASKGIHRLAQLAEDLDKISKLESGKTLVHLESFVIQDLIRDVFEELSLKAQKKNISLDFKKGTESPITVYADKAKIKQVIVNLVVNAIKYGNQDGYITAGCYLMDGKSVYIEISDNGIGIGEEHLPRLFERFYRADKSRNRDIGGTGLGLAIVKHIIEAHGHSINVRSKIGIGSSFGFTLSREKK